jgi:hypothetical protein
MGYARFAKGLCAASLATAAALALLLPSTSVGAVSMVSCAGKYTATVHDGNNVWKTTVSNVREHGTTCRNARALAGAYARVTCSSCPTHHTIAGYRVRERFDNHGYYTAVTFTKGRVVVTCRQTTFLANL